jgi:hypothetical protein
MESRTALLIPVFSKPLRAQPLYVQIGHIEALTYCLGLRFVPLQHTQHAQHTNMHNISFPSIYWSQKYFCRPPLLEFSPELLRLLKEALTIAEIDDTQQPQTKLPTHKSHIQSISLRVVCYPSLLSSFFIPSVAFFPHLLLFLTLLDRLQLNSCRLLWHALSSRALRTKNSETKSLACFSRYIFILYIDKALDPII